MVLLAVAVSTPARAVVLSNPEDGTSLFGQARRGSFLDVYNFSLTRTLGVGASTSYATIAGTTSVQHFRTQVFTATGNVPLITGVNGVIDTNWKSNVLLLPSLAAGAYRLEISGVGGGPRGGIYMGKLFAVAAPVPEASSWAMTLSGLALIGAVVWRRRRSGRRGEAP